jgi:hypothetical protein
MTRMLAAAVCVGLVSAPALAQTPAPEAPPPTSAAAAASTPLRDRFQVDLGYYRINSDSVLYLTNGSGVRSEVNFEKDLGLSPSANTFWVDTTWRLGTRHQLKLDFTKFTREFQSKVLSRTFIWNEKTFGAGLSASSTIGSTVTAFYYRYALVKHDRFEIGPAVGIGYLKFKAGITATGTVVVSGSASQSVTLDESGSKGTITGDLGAYFNVWAHRNVAVRGDFLYMKVKPGQSVAAITDSRIAVDVYPWTRVGFGAQYKYNKYSYDLDIRKAGLGGHVTYSGGQVYLSFLFP